jgi:hypothetical protein
LAAEKCADHDREGDKVPAQAGEHAQGRLRINTMDATDTIFI